MIYLISDTHFNHKNILAYENRPFNSVSDMNNQLIKRWNEIVAPDDTVYHLGDFALGSAHDLDWLINSLNGHKILIRGNHDHSSRNRYLNAGFEGVMPFLVLQYNGRSILLTHTPDGHPEIQHDLHFYGHVHSKGMDLFPTIARNGACLCVERWNYEPVPLDEVIRLCDMAAFVAPAVV